MGVDNNMATVLYFVQPFIPLDCRLVIYDYIPSIIIQRCHVCGLVIVMKDRRNRLHVSSHIVCTEAVVVCEECFECFYE